MIIKVHIFYLHIKIMYYWHKLITKNNPLRRENKKWIKNPQINEYSLSLSHLQGFSFTITCMPNVILAFLATYTSHPYIY